MALKFNGLIGAHLSLIHILLIPASGSCALNASPEEMPDALASCQEMARAGNMQAAFELGEYYYCLLYTSRCV